MKRRFLAILFDMKHVPSRIPRLCRCIPALLCLCTAFFCAACTAVENGARPLAETPVPTAVSTPTPTPVPMPIVAVWADGEANAFLEGVAAAAGDGLRTTCIQNGADALAAFPFEGQTVLLCCLTASEPDFAPLLALAERGVPVLCYAASGQAIPEPLFALRYDNAGAAEAAMEALLAYPPHDTPVRVLGLFENGDGDAFRVFTAYAEAGKLLVRGTYEQSGAETESPEAALEAMLKKLYPGMLDAVFAETPALAQAAANVLSSLSRGDAEVFCASANEALLNAMLTRPALLAYAAGENPWYAGRLAREYAGRHALGLAIERDTVLFPRGYASDMLSDEWETLAYG